MVGNTFGSPGNIIENQYLVNKTVEQRKVCLPEGLSIACDAKWLYLCAANFHKI